MAATLCLAVGFAPVKTALAADANDPPGSPQTQPETPPEPPKEPKFGLELGPAADSEGRARVLVVAVAGILDGVSAAIADRLAALLADQVLGQRGLALTTPGAAAAAAAGHSSWSRFSSAGDTVLSEARAQEAKARKAMAARRFDAAARSWRKAIAGLEGAFDRLAGPRELSEGYLQLAIAQLRTGHLPEGRRALVAAVRLEPERQLDAQYPPVFLRLYGEVQRRLAEGPRGQLRIAGAAAGLRVWLDGRERGATPATLEALPGGHWVSLGVSPGAAAAAEAPPRVTYAVRLAASGTLEVGPAGGAGGGDVAGDPVGQAVAAATAAAARVRAEVVQNLVDAEGVRALAELAQNSGADLVAFGGVHPLDDQGTALALDALVYSRQAKEVAALTRVQVDAQLATASAELAKVAAELVQKYAHWSDVVVIPSAIAPDAKSAPKTSPAKLGLRDAQRDDSEALLPPPADPQRRPADRRAADLGPEGEAHKEAKAGSGFPWGPLAIGVGAALLVTAGVIVGVNLANQKAGAPATVTW